MSSIDIDIAYVISTISGIWVDIKSQDEGLWLAAIFVSY